MLLRRTLGWLNAALACSFSTGQFEETMALTRRHILVAMVLSTSATDALGDVPIEKVIGTIERMSGQIASAKWKTTYRTGKLNDKGEFVPDNSPAFSEGSVVFEPLLPRFQVNLNSISVWAGGTAPFAGTRKRTAYDGTKVVDLERHCNGPNVPAEHPARSGKDVMPWEGTIRPQITEEIHMDLGWFSGIGYFTDRFWNKRITDRIRDELVRKSPVLVTEPKPGIWQIDMQHRGVSADRDRMRVFYDISKGAITQVVRFYAEQEMPWERVDVDLQQFEGFWVPKSMMWVSLASSQRPANRVVYTFSEINRPIDSKTYDLTLPPGARMVDHVNKKAYTVGQTPQNEAEMIKAFADHYGLHEPSPAPWWQRWHTWVGVAVVFGLASVAWWRRRQRLVVPLMLLVLTPNLYAQAEVKKLPHHDSQCGVQVTFFALTYFKLPFDAKALNAELRKDFQDGISLSRVASALERHGLRTEPRTKLNVKGLQTSLQSGWIAIIPVQGGPTCHDYDFSGKTVNWNHYVVAANHPIRGPLVVDVLRNVTPLEKSGLTDQHLLDSNRVVLFIRR